MLIFKKHSRRISWVTLVLFLAMTMVAGLPGQPAYAASVGGVTIFTDAEISTLDVDDEFVVNISVQNASVAGIDFGIEWDTDTLEVKYDEIEEAHVYGPKSPLNNWIQASPPENEQNWAGGKIQYAGSTAAETAITNNKIIYSITFVVKAQGASYVRFYAPSSHNHVTDSLGFIYADDDDAKTKYAVPAANITNDLASFYIGEASNDATLSALALSGVTLKPAFAAGTYSYTATVPNSVATTTVSATANAAGATVTAADLGLKDLAVGENTITVNVTAEDTTTTAAYTVVVTRANAAAWTATGSPSIRADKVYTTYKLMDGADQIELTAANIASITVTDPNSATATITPGSDPLLWFDVEQPAGDYSYIIVTEAGTTYSATLTWTAPLTAAWSATGEEVVAPHNDYLYKEYQLMYNNAPISLAAGAVDLIALKDAGKWGALTANTEATLWFDKAKATGNYEYLIANASGIYKATLAWIASPVPVSAITVSGAAGADTMLDAAHDGELQMSAEVIPANAADRGVTWSVIDGTGSAAISTEGLLSQGELGTVTVRATAKDGSTIYGEKVITVKGVKMTPASATIVVDGTEQLAAEAVPADTTTFTWESSDTAIATVDGDGLVTAVAEGTATITATTADGREGICAVSVTPKPPAYILDLTISEGTLEPAFDSDTYNYRATVANSVTEITITAQEEGDMTATGDIGTFDLTVGSNTFAIQVAGDAGHADAVYTVVITRRTGGGGGGGGGGGAATPTVTAMEIKSAPDKLVYTEGDALDLSGLEVTLNYSNGNKKNVVLADFAANQITVTPKDGEILDTTDSEILISVDGVTVKQAITVNKKEGVTPPPVEPVLTDIDQHWAQDNIEYLVGIGAISGYPDETFRPDGLITRAEFAKIIVDAFELEAESGKIFADTDGHWAQDYIAVAAARGIVLGYNDQEFGPDDLITREQMAIMIVKTAGLKETAGELDFTDQAEVSDWAYQWVVSATQNKLMSGYTDNTFKPLKNATRAEAATVIYNLLMK